MAAMTHAQAQRVVEETDLKETEETVEQTETGDDGVKQSPSTGDLFDGLTRPITFDRMIPPYALEVTFYKTVHIIFPATIKYVDLGSADIIAGKADGSENVLRVKAALRDFSRETNLAVITEAAAINHRTRKMGYNAAEALTTQVSLNIQRRQKEREEQEKRRNRT